MIRTPLISATILTALGLMTPCQAAGLVSSFVVERGDAGRVKEVVGPARAAVEATIVDVHFGMGRAASQGFVAASGRPQREVSVARGPLPSSALCLPGGAGDEILRLR